MCCNNVLYVVSRHGSVWGPEWADSVSVVGWSCSTGPTLSPQSSSAPSHLAGGRRHATLRPQVRTHGQASAHHTLRHGLRPEGLQVSLPLSVFLMRVGWGYIWVKRHCLSSDREHITRYLARVLKLFMSHYTTVVVGRYRYFNDRVSDTGSICTCKFWYRYHNHALGTISNIWLRYQS